MIISDAAKPEILKIKLTTKENLLIRMIFLTLVVKHYVKNSLELERQYFIFVADQSRIEYVWVKIVICTQG